MVCTSLGSLLRPLLYFLCSNLKANPVLLRVCHAFRPASRLRSSATVRFIIDNLLSAICGFVDVTISKWKTYLQGEIDIYAELVGLQVFEIATVLPRGTGLPRG